MTWHAFGSGKIALSIDIAFYLVPKHTLMFAAVCCEVQRILLLSFISL